MSEATSRLSRYTVLVFVPIIMTCSRHAFLGRITTQYVQEIEIGLIKEKRERQPPAETYYYKPTCTQEKSHQVTYVGVP